MGLLETARVVELWLGIWVPLSLRMAVTSPALSFLIHAIHLTRLPVLAGYQPNMKVFSLRSLSSAINSGFIILINSNLHRVPTISLRLLLNAERNIKVGCHLFCCLSQTSLNLTHESKSLNTLHSCEPHDPHVDWISGWVYFTASLSFLHV